MSWTASGRITNPTLDQVLVDTGPLVAGVYFFSVFAAATVASAFELQWRNAANAATLKSQIVAVPANTTIWGFEVANGLYIDVAASERIRIIQVAAVTGSVSVSLVGSF